MNNLISNDSVILARKRETIRLRANLIQGIRRYFINQNFLEVETPLRIPAPAPEENIEALSSGDWFLQTSPELCMKRLLAADYEKIFQFCRCFRAGERGRMHFPEFTMLEWYVAGFDYRQLMNQCEEMLIAAADHLGFAHGLERQGKPISLAAPWERITVREAFARYAPTTPEEALASDKFDEILVEYIEPNLGIDKPTFIYDYPAKLGALARLRKDDNSVAERFELYIGGVELANGFSELTDSREQRSRFEEAQILRAQKGFAAYPMPERFLRSLDALPDSAGIALGIDRLVMIFADTADINDVVCFPPELL